MIVIRKETVLDAPIAVEALTGVAFSAENRGHQFVISCQRGGMPVYLAGTVSARFVRADGSTILIAEDDAQAVDGKAVVTLHQDCYNVPGRFHFYIFHTTNSDTTCIYSCTGTVQRTQVGTLIDSGDAVPSLDDVIAMYQDVREATAAARDSAADNIGLKASVTTAASATGTQIEIADALSMPPDSITVEIEPSQSDTPTPSSPIDVAGISDITFTRADSEGQNANTIEVDLAEAAGGTVYGGTLTLNANGTGTLTLKWAKKTLAKIDEDGGGFGYYANGTHPLFRILMPGRKIGTNVVGFCNTYNFDRAASLGSLSTNVPDKCFGYQSTLTYIVFRNDDYRESDYDSRADMIAAWLAANVNTYVVYELDAPIEIPIEFTPVSLYDGGNILTNDAGLSMAVAYRKDKYFTVDEADDVFYSLASLFNRVGLPDQSAINHNYVLKAQWVRPIGGPPEPSLYVRWELEDS